LPSRRKFCFVGHDLNVALQPPAKRSKTPTLGWGRSRTSSSTRPTRCAAADSHQAIIADDRATNPKLKLLVRALARVYEMCLKLESGEAKSVPDLVAQLGIGESFVHKILPIGFLAPDLMKQILDGRQPSSLQIGHISDGKLSLDWAAQRALFASL
jgi:hypothetical protein